MNNAELFYRASQPRKIGGAPPLTFKSNGGAITDYTITGAAGGVGERTAQLIPEVVQGGVNADTGALSSNTRRVRTNRISIQGGETYTLNAGTQYIATIVFYTDGVYDSSVSGITAGIKKKTFTVPAAANEIATGFIKSDPSATFNPSELQGYMLNAGDEALPAEPYGCKIPVSCGGVTTDIYIGETALSQHEYANYGEQKVFKRTANLINAEDVGVQRVELEAKEKYCLSKYVDSGVGSPSCYVYDETGKRLFGDYIRNWVAYAFTNTVNGSYALIMFDETCKGKLSFVKGIEDATSGSTTRYPTEYTPFIASTDPPVPLPAIATARGENTLTVDTTTQPSEITIKTPGTLPPTLAQALRLKYDIRRDE